MERVVHPESGLAKATWGEDDLDAMSWDRCRVHAFAVTDYEPPSGLTPEEHLELDDIDDTAPSGLELHLDLDYVVRRIELPGPLFPTYRYWVSPATLTFGAVSGLSGDLVSVDRPLEMTGLHRLTPVVPRDEMRWHIEGSNFNLTFYAWHYVMVLRRRPVYGERYLQRDNRGGISFDTRPFA